MLATMNWVLSFCLFITAMDATMANYTFTYEMASKCKRHTSKHGYKYEVYHKADSNVRQVTNAANLVFELHFAILAASNGHILLSSVPQPESGDPVYEIVVGGGGNKFTELRRNLRRNSKATDKTPEILSAIEYRAFYIKIDEDGLVEFGREGDKVPLLSYMDTDPVNVKYFSFTSWNGVEALFLYDCPVAGENGTLPDSKTVEPKLSNSEQLQRSLLKDRQIHLAPSSVVPVKFGVKLISVKYNAFEAKLYTDLAVVVSWTDDSMAWNPMKFNGITNLLFRQGQIWMPTFLITNSADISVLEPRNADLISMIYTGEATFHFQTKVTTWCVDYSVTLNKWPRDQYSCDIIMEPWNAHETIKLEYLAPATTKMKIFTETDSVMETQWKVSGNQGVITPSMWNKAIMKPYDDNSTLNSDKFRIKLNLTRFAYAYNIVFYTPLIVLLTFLLCSFWTEPLKTSRVWFYAGSAIFVCLGLSYIDYLVPCHTVPTILILYITVLMSILLALVINILMLNSMMQYVYKSRLMQYLFTSKTFRIVFGLGVLKTCNTYESINQGFMDQEDDDSGVVIASRSGNVEAMLVDNNNKTVGEREEFAEIIDKIMFFSYSVVFAVMLACHY